MKKKFFLTTLVITLVFAITFCGCGNSSTASKSDDSYNESESEMISEDLTYSLEDFREVKTSDKYLYIYREEVKSRLKTLDEEANFCTDNEWNAIRKHWDGTFRMTHNSFISYSNGDSIEYFFPIIYREGTSLILWYTCKNGSVMIDEIKGNYSCNSNYLGSLHCDEDNKSIERIYNTNAVVVTFNNESYIAQKWEFGKAVLSTQLPKGSVYCGLSYFEGLIFRAGTDVYSIKEDGNPTVIAHDVKYVIDTEYYCGSDPWSQPLFLMEDGTVKAYISWEGNKDAAPDDESHLVAPPHEGSYEKFCN